MRTFIVAVTCLSLGAGLSHAEDITDVLGGLFKTPSKADKRAELEPLMDKLDVNALQALTVDYAHRVDVLEARAEKSRISRQKKSDIISELRTQIRACEMN